MPGVRSSMRPTPTSAWRTQAQLDSLVAGVLAMPHACSLPGYVQAAVDTVIRCLASSHGSHTSQGRMAEQMSGTRETATGITPTATTGTGLAATSRAATVAAAVHSNGLGAVGRQAVVGSDAAASQLAGDVGMQAAVQHLQHMLSSIPAGLEVMAHAMLHDMLLLATWEGRQAAAALGADVDDLALPATWCLSCHQYTQLVAAFQWEGLLLDSLQLLGVLGATWQADDSPTSKSEASSSTSDHTKDVQYMQGPRTGEPDRIQDGEGKPGSGRGSGAHIALVLLQQLLAADAQLSIPLLQLLLPRDTSEAGTPSRAGLLASTVAHADLWQVFHALLACLDNINWTVAGRIAQASSAALQEMSSRTGADQCLQLCMCMCGLARCGLHSWYALAAATAGHTAASTSSASAKVTACDVVQLAAGQLEQLLCQLTEMLQVTAAAAHTGAGGERHSKVQLLVGDLHALATEIDTGMQQQAQQQGSHASWPTAVALRLKCRVALTCPVLQELVNKQQQGSSQGNIKDEANSNLLSSNSSCSSSTGTSACIVQPLSGLLQPPPDQPIEAALQIVARHGCAAGDLLSHESHTAQQQTWLRALQPALPMQSKHGLSPVVISQLQSYATSMSPGSDTVRLPAQHGQQGYSLSTAGRTMAECWEQRVIAWVMATLTPGLPCPWQCLRMPAVRQSLGAGVYTVLSVALALIELAACLKAPSDKPFDVVLQCSLDDKASSLQSVSSPIQQIEAVRCPTQQIRAASQIMVGGLLPTHALLPDLLLSVAAMTMQHITQPEQQLALQHAVQGTLCISRLISSLDSQTSMVSGSNAALVWHSNHVVAGAQQHQGVALSSAAQAKLVAAAACQVLPYAVLMPQLLLQHLVQGCVSQPGQLGVVLDLLCGPLQPTALLLQPMPPELCVRHTTTPTDAQQESQRHSGQKAQQVPALIAVLQQLVLDMCGGKQANSSPQVKAMLALISGCLGGAVHQLGQSVATPGIAQRPVLLSQLTLLLYLALPLLEWFERSNTPLTQVHPVLTTTLHILSHTQPGIDLGTSADGLQSSWCAALQSLVASTEQYPACDSSAPVGQPVVRLVTTTCQLATRLQQYAREQGVVLTSSIEQATTLLEGLSSTLQQLLPASAAAPEGRLGSNNMRAQVASVAGGLLSYASQAEASQVLLQLPLLQACCAVCPSRPNLHEATGEEEDQDTAWSSQLLRAMMPADVWRPPLTKAKAVVPSQVEQALLFSSSADAHVEHLLDSIAAWVQEEVAEYFEEHQGVEASSANSRCLVAAQACMVLLQKNLPPLLASNAAVGELGAGRPQQQGRTALAYSCARTMQRQLCRSGRDGRAAAAQLLQAGLLAQLAGLLPSLSSSQAARVVLGAAPAMAAVTVVLDPAPACGWAQQQVASYMPLTPAVQIAAATQQSLGSSLQQRLMSTAPAEHMAGEQEQAGPVVLHLAYSLHMLCAVVQQMARHRADNAPAAPTSAQLDRCLQHLGAALTTLLPKTKGAASGSSAATTTGSRPGTHDNGAGSAASSATGANFRSGVQAMLDGEQRWLLAMLMLPQLLACFQALAAAGTGIQLGQVCLLQVLRAVLQPACLQVVTRSQPSALHITLAQAESKHHAGAGPLASTEQQSSTALETGARALPSIERQAGTGLAAHTGQSAVLGLGQQEALPAGRGPAPKQHQQASLIVTALDASYASVVQAIGQVLCKAAASSELGSGTLLQPVQMAASQMVDEQVMELFGSQADSECVLGLSLDEVFLGEAT